MADGFSVVHVNNLSREQWNAFFQLQIEHLEKHFNSGPSEPEKQEFRKSVEPKLRAERNAFVLFNGSEMIGFATFSLENGAVRMRDGYIKEKFDNSDLRLRLENAVQGHYLRELAKSARFEKNHARRKLRSLRRNPSARRRR
jgi:hypothetical protein